MGVAGSQIYTIPHFNRNKISVSRCIRREWIFGPHSEDELLFIAGECSMVDNIAEGLEKGYIVKLVCGPGVKNLKVQQKLAELLERYGPEKLQIRSLPKRPKRHYAIINGNVLFEGNHKEGEEYVEATVIQPIDPENKALMTNYFNELFNKGIEKTKKEHIMNMPLIEKAAG